MSNAQAANSVSGQASEVSELERLLCRARVCAEAGAAYVEQQQVDGTQLVHAEVAELFGTVADAIREVRRELSDIASGAVVDREPRRHPEGP